MDNQCRSNLYSGRKDEKTGFGGRTRKELYGFSLGPSRGDDANVTEGADFSNCDIIWRRFLRCTRTSRSITGMGTTKIESTSGISALALIKTNGFEQIGSLRKRSTVVMMYCQKDPYREHRCLLQLLNQMTTMTAVTEMSKTANLMKPYAWKVFHGSPVIDTNLGYSSRKSVKTTFQHAEIQRQSNMGNTKLKRDRSFHGVPFIVRPIENIAYSRNAFHPGTVVHAVRHCSIGMY
ncbi:hypothetical protein RB195_020578 [Necator americanus]|uniref:Uncharacterized protein n=1 Tax=Necator americanus TaxID=51031 RepID=A0ABR1CJU0_NECAM